MAGACLSPALSADRHRISTAGCRRVTPMINLRKGNSLKCQTLTIGHQSHSLAPIQILQTAYQQYLSSSAAASGLAYGLDPGPPETQSAIATWLRKVYSLRDNPSAYRHCVPMILTCRDNILITGGASMGLNNALQKVTWPGPTRRIFMIAPTYYLAAGIFKGSDYCPKVNVDCGYSDRISGIPEDDQGLDIFVLQSQIDKLEQEPDIDRPSWQKWTYRYVFYGVPTFSNPTGSIMSLERRVKLLTVLV